MILIVGLGNPGKEYEKTYHNIGFLTVDALAISLGAKFSKSYGKALVAETFFNNQKIIIAKPQTFMNLSGESVLSIKNKFKIEEKNILVVLDDIDLKLGDVRFRKEGSAGTHNGLRNIVLNLKTTTFPRLRLGVGKDEKMDLADFVLSKISKESDEILQQSILKSVDLITENFLSKRD